MKKLILIIVLAAVAFGGWKLWNKTPVEQEPLGNVGGEEVMLTDGSYAVSSSSTLSWSGKRPLIPGYIDRGNVAIRDGGIIVSGGAITGGSFTVDMATIAAISTGRGDGEDRLSGHLKSADFFDVANFPTATFTITNTTPAGEITGNLTVKGMTESITFPARLSQEGDTIRAQADITLDRTKWNIRYGSGKFFEDLGNNLIDDMFTITLDLSATKTQ